MIDVRQHLVIGIRVYGRHQAVDDANLVMQRLYQGRETISGARSVGDDGMRGLERLMVDAEDDRRVDILSARRGDNHFLGAALEMRGRLFLGSEQARAFEYHVYAQRGPRALRRGAPG